MATVIFCFLLITLALAQAPQDPIKNFCRRYGHQTAVVDRKLFIDGGWLYANPLLDNPQPTINQGILYGDLDTLNTNQFPTIYNNLTKNSSIPDVAGGILWADDINKIVWLYGGEYSSAPSTFQLWGYDVALNQWNLSTAGIEATGSVRRAAYGAGTTVSGLGKGYYYGGYLNSLTTPLWSGPQYATNGLIVYDMDHNTLTNKSGPYDGLGRAEGVMVAINASAAGLLIYFGGVTYPYRNTTAVPQPMDTILIYDLGDEKWYSQKAAGDIPGNRRKFCGGVAAANDQSSYNIYIYGGIGFGENITGFDDVYILTMPTFQWTKWYPEPGAATRPHAILSCDVINNSQMIIMGGNFSLDNDCDVPAILGMHNLNLGQNDPDNAKWYRFLPNLTSYSVPPAIVSLVGGSPAGGATNLTPVAGFGDPALKVYFSAKASFAARTPTRLMPTATNTAQSANKSVNAGVVIGAAVGGSVVLIAAAVAIFFCRRRKARKRQKPAPSRSPPPPRQELHSISQLDEKTKAATRVVSTPSSVHSPIPSPHQSTPLPSPPQQPMPGYPYFSAFSTDPAYRQYYHQQLNPSHSSHIFPQQPHMYAYQGYHIGPTTPPHGWVPHSAQHQYFPPPSEHQRISPSLQEMPTVLSPRPEDTSNTREHPGGEQVVYRPSPARNGVTPIRRREVGRTSSHATGTVTTHSDNYSMD